METSSIQPSAPVALAKFCKQAGVSRATAWKWRKAGWLEVVNVGGRVFITPEAAAEFSRRAAAGEFNRTIRPPLADRTRE